MSTPRGRWCATILAVVLVAGACGGDDDDGGADGGGSAADGGAGSTTTTTAGEPATTTSSGPPDTAAPTTVSTLPPEDDAGEECGIGLLEAADGTVELELWHAMGSDNQTTLEDMVSRYNAEQQRVAVTPAFQGTYDDTVEKFRQSLGGGDLPHLVQLEETQLRYGVDSGALLAAQDCVDGSDYSFDDFLAPVVNEFVVDGRLWPMPFNTSSLVLYYDRAAFTAAGLDPDQPPATLDDLRAAARAVVDSGYTQTGMSMILESWWLEQWVATSGQPYVDQGNGRDGLATELLLGGDVGVELFAWIDGMLDDGLATSFGIVEDSDLGYLTALLPGGGQSQAAMTLGTSAALGGAIALLGGGDFEVDLGVGPLPTVVGGVGGVTTSGAAVWIVAEGTEPLERAAAWDFLQWLNEPEQLAEWHERTGYLPNTVTASESERVQALWATQPLFRVAYDQLFASNVGVAAGPVIGPYLEVRDAVEGALEDMVLSGTAPADAVAQAQDEAADLLADYIDRVG